MKTSTAEENNYICPICGGRVAEDSKGQGYARHIDYGNLRHCDFDKSRRDEISRLRKP